VNDHQRFDRTKSRSARIAILCASVAIAASFLGVTPAAAANEYPTWDDVRQAQLNESAKKTEVDRLSSFITQLQTQSDSLRATANQAALSYETALRNALDAENTSIKLNEKLEDASTEAASTAKEAGALFATLGRMNDGDVPLQLLVGNSSDAQNTLYKLGALARFTDRSNSIMNLAKQNANQVKALTEQAEEASKILATTQAEAEAKLTAANDAAAAANAALQEQQARESTLIEQLAFLKGSRIETESEYQKGVAAAAAAKAAAEKAAAEAAARAAAQARNQAQGNNNTGPVVPPPVSGAAGSYFVPSAQGWWRPVPGSVTSPYGPRKVICNGAGCSTNFHDGVDLAGSCGTAIKAVSSGTVVFAGNAGGFGNRIIIDHGGGVRTIYGHMQARSFKVGVGDSVAAGTPIGGVGATGVVTGCHLDIKVTVGGSGTNPSTFLRGKGIFL